MLQKNLFGDSLQEPVVFRGRGKGKQLEIGHYCHAQGHWKSLCPFLKSNSTLETGRWYLQQWWRAGFHTLNMGGLGTVHWFFVAVFFGDLQTLTYSSDRAKITFIVNLLLGNGFFQLWRVLSRTWVGVWSTRFKAVKQRQDFFISARMQHQPQIAPFSSASTEHFEGYLSRSCLPWCAGADPALLRDKLNK